MIPRIFGAARSIPRNVAFLPLAWNEDRVPCPKGFPCPKRFSVIQECFPLIQEGFPFIREGFFSLYPGVFPCPKRISWPFPKMPTEGCGMSHPGARGASSQSLELGLGMPAEAALAGSVESRKGCAPIWLEDGALRQKGLGIHGKAMGRSPDLGSGMPAEAAFPGSVG